jgi:nucleoside-diphosphate-sugar epimerase
LSIRDSFKIFKFCLEKDFFDNDIFNALSGNFTVNQILNKIKKIKKKINIVYVKSPIMNQLSYHVDDQKIKNKGLILKSNIDVDIKDTLLLFKYLKNEM